MPTAKGPRDHDPRRVRTSPDRACRQSRDPQRRKGRYGGEAGRNARPANRYPRPRWEMSRLDHQTRTGAVRWFNNEKDRPADSSVSRSQQVCCSLFRNRTFEPRYQRTETRLEDTGAELRLLIPTNFEPGGPLEHTPGGPFTSKARSRALLAAACRA
jgi:hypothetical protein